MGNFNKRYSLTVYYVKVLHKNSFWHNSFYARIEIKREREKLNFESKWNKFSSQNSFAF